MMRVGNWLLAGLHLLLALATPIVVLLLTGCLKGQARPGVLGPEVSAEQVNAALQKQMNSGNLGNMKVGQYVDFAVTQRIEGEDFDSPVGSRHVEVINRQDDATTATFTMRITQDALQSNGSNQTVVTEDSITLKKTSSLSAQGLAANVNAAADSQKTTFHNLAESDGVMDPPDSVKNRAGCGGMSSCSLNVHYLQFDMAVWSDATNYQKISFDFAFSTQSPYLPYGSDFNQLTGLLIQDCRSTYIPIPNSIPVYVRSCSTLDDFQQ
jgi:hypothetical protein